MNDPKPVIVSVRHRQEADAVVVPERAVTYNHAADKIAECTAEKDVRGPVALVINPG